MSLKKITAATPAYNNYLISFSDGFTLSVGVPSAKLPDAGDHTSVTARIKERLDTVEFEIIERNSQPRAAF